MLAQHVAHAFERWLAYSVLVAAWASQCGDALLILRIVSRDDVLDPDRVSNPLPAGPLPPPVFCKILIYKEFARRCL